MSPAEEYSKRQTELRKEIEKTTKEILSPGWDMVLSVLEAKFTRRECPISVKAKQENLLLTLKSISLHDLLVGKDPK